MSALLALRGRLPPELVAHIAAFFQDGLEAQLRACVRADKADDFVFVLDVHLRARRLHHLLRAPASYADWCAQVDALPVLRVHSDAFIRFCYKATGIFWPSQAYAHRWRVVWARLCAADVTIDHRYCALFADMALRWPAKPRVVLYVAHEELRFVMSAYCKTYAWLPSLDVVAMRVNVAAAEFAWMERALARRKTPARVRFPLAKVHAPDLAPMQRRALAELLVPFARAVEWI
jgi:hypothetical protein